MSPVLGGTSFLCRLSSSSSTCCSLCRDMRQRVCNGRLRLIAYVLFWSAKTLDKPRFSVGNPPCPAPGANEHDVAGCRRSSAATPCSRFASLPGQASWVQPRQREMILCHSRLVHLTSDMLRFYELHILCFLEVLWNVMMFSFMGDCSCYGGF